MHIRRIRIFQLNIPFRLPVSHNLAERHEGEALVVVVEDEKGNKGFGEGTPREYVSGETLPDTLDAAMTLAGQLTGSVPESFEALKALLVEQGTTPPGMAYPSALCALETACFDLWGKRKDKPIWQLFSDRPKCETFIYSAVLPILSEKASAELLQLIGSKRMKYIKVKVDALLSGIDSIEKVRLTLGDDTNIRVDANGAFTASEAFSFLDSAVAYNISAFEQPVPKSRPDWMRDVAQHSSVPIIADESLCSMKEAQDLIDKGACQGFNIRLSKCGGLMKSLSLFELARDNGIFCQIGCHVGETAILSAAGRHLAALCPEITYFEGSFSKYVLKKDLVNEDISFGDEGSAPLLEGAGLGIRIDEKRIEELGRPL